MAYTEIKTIKGRKYRYERVSYRKGSVVKHTSRYLGAVHPLNKRSNAGRKPTLKVIELSESEKDFVQQNLKSSKSFVKDRARIIDWSSRGKTVKEICTETGFHRPKVEKLLKEFNQRRLAIFKRGKSTGKPRRITPEQRAHILQSLNTHPSKLGLHFTSWTLKKLSIYAKKQGIQIGPSQVGRIIKQDEIKYKKKVPHLYSDDPDFAKKNLL
jgi:transposase